MKNLKDIIIERLHLNKDMKTPENFNKYFDEGEEVLFKDINIYKTNCRYPKVIGDRTLINEINKYFNDDDTVFLITKQYYDKLNNEEVWEDIKPDKKPIMQKVYLITGRVGFYIKNIPSINGICLIKKFFGNKKQKPLQKTQYIFKFNYDITERLHLNKNTWEDLYDFNIKISDTCVFTKENIDNIISIIKNKFWPEIIPEYITNYKFDIQHEKLWAAPNALFLFYNDKYIHTKISKLNYIMIYKSNNYTSPYAVDVHLGSGNHFEVETAWHNSIEDAFDECFSTLNKDIKLNE